MQPNALPFRLDISERELVGKSTSYHLVTLEERTMDQVSVSCSFSVVSQGPQE